MRRLWQPATQPIAGILIGALGIYFADAGAGGRRRARVRDRLIHLARATRCRAIRFARHSTSGARGAVEHRLQKAPGGGVKQAEADQLAGFRDRLDAGEQLAKALASYGGRNDLVVLGIARGGLPVAAKVAEALHAPLDVVVVRKLGFPGQEELAMGAIGPGGVRVLNEEVLADLPAPQAVIEETVRRELQELERRERTYRAGRPPLVLRDRTVIIVDDGVATGATMRAAIAAVRAQGAHTVVVGIPVAAESTRRRIAAECDRLVCLISSDFFFAVGQWYSDFSATTDDDVRRLLQAHNAPEIPASPRQGSES